MKQISSIIIFFLFTSCADPLIPSKFYKHLEFLKHNDTMVFKSNRNELDTFIITRVDSGHCSKRIIMAEECETFIKVYYKIFPFREKFGKFEIPDTTDKVLFSLVKYPKNEIEISLEFRGFISWGENTFGFQKGDTIINTLKFKNIYILTQESARIIDRDLPDSLYTENVIWTDKDGIIAYTCKNGSIWTRIMNNKN